MLGDSDFVSLHCPSTKETQGIINYDMISKMKNSAYLINTARGDIVVEDDLVRALQDNLIKGAGLDVYEAEPKVNEGLLNQKKVFLLPHLGSATKETRTAMANLAIDNLDEYFKTGHCKNKVN